MVPSISNQRVATDSSRNSAQEKSRIETLWASFQGEKKLKKQSDPIGLSDLIVPTVPDSSSATQISTSEEQNNVRLSWGNNQIFSTVLLFQVSMALTSSEETAATTSGNETESPTVSSAGKMEQSQYALIFFFFSFKSIRRS